MEAAGGLERFLERYAVILCADHGQSTVREAFELRTALPDLPQFVSSLRSTPADSAIAVAASNRAAMVYRLTDAPTARELAARVEELPQVDLVAFREDGWDVVRARRRGAALPARPAGDPDRRGNRWRLAGEPRRPRAGAGRRRSSPRPPTPTRWSGSTRSCSASTPARS